MLDGVLKKNDVGTADALVSNLFSWIDDELIDIIRDVDSGTLSNEDVCELLEALREKIY